MLLQEAREAHKQALNKLVTEVLAMQLKTVFFNTLIGLFMQSKHDCDFSVFEPL